MTSEGSGQHGDGRGLIRAALLVDDGYRAGARKVLGHLADVFPLVQLEIGRSQREAEAIEQSTESLCGGLCSDVRRQEASRFPKRTTTGRSRFFNSAFPFEHPWLRPCHHSVGGGRSTDARFLGRHQI